MKEYTLRMAALAAIDEAENYLEEARLLCDHGRHARAASLGVLGREELGKGVLFVIAALDAVPGLRHQLQGKSWAKTQHALKQLVGGLVGHAESIVDEYTDAVSYDARRAADAVWWAEQFMKVSIDWAQGLLSDKKAAKRYHQEFLERARESYERANLPQDISSPPETPDELKERGLYVDIKDDVLVTPGSVTGSQAQAEIDDLNCDLLAMTRLRGVVADDKLWKELRGRC